MSRPFLTDTGIEVPKPLNRVVHRHHDWSAQDEPIEFHVIESEFKDFLTLNVSVKTPRYAWVAADYLAGLAQLRIAGGWRLVTLTDTSAFFVPEETT